MLNSERSCVLASLYYSATTQAKVSLHYGSPGGTFVLLSIHPSIFYTCLIRQSGRGGAGAYPSGGLTIMANIMHVR